MGWKRYYVMSESSIPDPDADSNKDKKLENVFRLTLVYSTSGAIGDETEKFQKRVAHDLQKGKPFNQLRDLIAHLLSSVGYRDVQPDPPSSV